MSNFIVDQLLSGYLLAALPFAIFAGVISFLSPCVLPLVPGYLAYAAGFSKSRGQVFLGFSLSLALARSSFHTARSLVESARKFSPMKDSLRASLEL